MSKDQLKLDEWDIVKWLTVVSDDYCMERCLEAAEEIKRLRTREARLREVLNQYSCGCSGPCWYPKDSPSCGLKARTALEEEKRG